MNHYSNVDLGTGLSFYAVIVGAIQTALFAISHRTIVSSFISWHLYLAATGHFAAEIQQKWERYSYVA
ncbi:hypothetical protein [uncultured Shewanella sp.]|uniref:hypothetical protein n=1 Tax=uncultured Shewanella sp. TaxID=173975 RepID=UPI00260450EB|nr:hypothetical protein [uncultured Shewanella sp.]